jgi:transcriptional pleiotropic regulator of transition state genes
MKSTGIVRPIDELGRFVIPMEIRRNLGIAAKDPLEVFIDEDSIILRKYHNCDIFTGETEELFVFEGRTVSKKSIPGLLKAAGLKFEEI